MDADSQKTRYLEYINTPEGYDNYNDFKDFLYGKNDSLTRRLVTDHIRPFMQLLRKESVRICDIGGGDGKRISHIVSDLFEKDGVTTSLTFIEPSVAGSSMFEKKQGSVKGFDHIIFFNGRFEEFETTEKFDLIILIHSIFTFSDKETIRKILDLKSENGKIIIVANDQNSFLAKLNREISKDYSEKRFEITDLEKIFDEKGIGYRKSEIVTSFSVAKDSFDTFSETLLKWVSLGKFHAYKEEQKRNLKQKLVSFAGSERMAGLLFKEVEVVIEIE